MKRGDIFFDSKFRFSDGEYGEKLFILVNEPTGDDPYLVLKTTSQPKHYAGVSHGCNKNRYVFFLLKAYYRESFSKDTYVQLEEVFEYSAMQMVVGGISRQIDHKGSLAPSTINAIVNCLKSLKDDISYEHYKLIFK